MSTDLELWVENSVFTIQHIGNRKVFKVPPPPRDKAKSFAYSCSFTLHTTYKMACLVAGAVKTLKNNLL